MNWKASLSSLDVGALIIAGGAAPAAALTESGSITCSNGAKRAVVGEQQRLGDRLTVKLGSVTRSQSNVYRLRYVAGGGGTSSWSGESVSLLLSGTGGYCQPL